VASWKPPRLVATPTTQLRLAKFATLEKKGYVGASTVCPPCQADARFVEHRPKAWLTPNGDVTAARAYYPCDHCGQGHCPFDQANGLRGDHLSTGLRPLVCLAGVLESFRDGADDILRRFAPLGVSRIALTHADETGHVGPAVGLAIRSGRPFSYISSGTAVHSGLLPVNPAAFASIILP
jgi:hypothetical protein